MRFAPNRLILSLAIPLAVVLVLSATACGSDDDDTTDGDRITVVATTTQIEALAREVAGDTVDLVGILPAGADAHEFEPTASDLVAIEGADLILRHGIGLDDWLDRTLRAGGSATVVEVTAGIALQAPALEHADEDEDHEDGDEEGEAHNEEGMDPHVWLDPDRAQQMVDNIATALSSVDSARAQEYADNAATYKLRLENAKAEIITILEEIPAENRKLVTNHDAFGYFASAFGLEIVGAVIPSTTTEAEPSAGATADLLDLVRNEGVKAIFAESSVNANLARSLAADAGVMIVDDLYGDSLGKAGSGAETVDGMLLANARKIADALK
jgi:ABC-type Zn uptake system ZnuABC Zn-binding protein ZnuA